MRGQFTLALTGPQVLQSGPGAPFAPAVRTKRQVLPSGRAARPHRSWCDTAGVLARQQETKQ